jgi:hypothetical protein
VFCGLAWLLEASHSFLPVAIMFNGELAHHGGEINEAHIMKFARRDGAAFTSFIIAKLVVYLALCLLSSWELYLGTISMAAVCGEPLAIWLRVDGATTLVYVALGLVNIRIKRVMCNSEFHAYLLRRERGADMDPVWEEQAKGMNTDLAASWLSDVCQSFAVCVDSQSVLDIVLMFLRWVLVLLFCAGCYWRFFPHSDAGCDPKLWGWTTGILIIRLLAPILSTCVILVSCMGTYWVKHPKDATRWDDMSTDHW